MDVNVVRWGRERRAWAATAHVLPRRTKTVSDVERALTSTSRVVDDDPLLNSRVGRPLDAGASDPGNWAEVSFEAMGQFLMADVARLGLFEAVAAGAHDRVLELLNSGWSADDDESEEGESERTRTPLLYIACKKQHAGIVSLLLKHGANPNAFYHRHSIIAG